MEHRVSILSLHVSELRNSIDGGGMLVWTRGSSKLVPDLYFIRIFFRFCSIRRLLELFLNGFSRFRARSCVFGILET